MTITQLATDKGVTLGCVTNWIRRGKVVVKNRKHGSRLVDRTTAPTVNKYNAGKQL